MTEEKKGITVKIDADLHAEVRQHLEANGMTMAEFVTLALRDELYPKFEQKEDNNMEKMRTMAFQVPESLFQKIKDYLQRNNMTQRQFVIGLVENEIERDLAQRQAALAEEPVAQDEEVLEEPEAEVEAQEETQEQEETEEAEVLFDENGFPIMEEDVEEAEEMTEDEEETQSLVLRM